MLKLELPTGHLENEIHSKKLLMVFRSKSGEFKKKTKPRKVTVLKN